MYCSISIIVLLFGYTQTQDANCDFSQNIVPGNTYYAYSPGYPNKYKPGITCRWVVNSPSGYKCRANCVVIDLPREENTSCLDRLLISTRGDPQLVSADYYCGRGTVTAVSIGQTMVLGLLTSERSPGGIFRCDLTAERSTPSSCSCGYRKVNRIVGGQETGVNEFTMMAGIIYNSLEAIKCGGVIISKSHVLTAAHCLINQPISELSVVVGEHNVDTGTDTSATRIIRVASYTIHPQYTASNYDYDIAVVTLASEISFSDRVGPVCLPFKFTNTDFTGAQVTMLGWGTQFPGGPVSKYLQKVDVNVISQASCKSSISSLTSRQFCTYSRGKDACQDDSGGPVLYTDPSTGVLYSLGIISYGRFCASNSPGVNTAVASLLNWVVANAPADYCVK